MPAVSFVTRDLDLWTPK